MATDIFGAIPDITKPPPLPPVDPNVTRTFGRGLPEPKPPEPPNPYFGGVDTVGRAAYDANQSLGFGHVRDQLVSNFSSPQWSWLSNQQGRYYQQYSDASIANPSSNLTWSEWLNQHAGGFMQDYQNQTPSEKGYSLWWQPAGRQN